MVCTAVLLWSYVPVSEAAAQDQGEAVLFLILPYPIGEAHWTGAAAMALGAALSALGAALMWLGVRGRYGGLDGFGTRFVALSVVLSGVGLLGWGGWLASTGHLTAPVCAANWFPVPMGFLYLRGWQLSHWHSVLIGAIAMSVTILVVKDGPGMLRELRRAARTGTLPDMRTDNGWVLVFRIFLALLFLNVVFYMLLWAFQVKTNVPAFGEEPLWQQLYMFANASVWEELLSRVLMLGVPLFAYYLLARRRRPVPGWRFLCGGGIPIDTAAGALLVFQGVVFGLAHVNGWDIFKAVPTVVTGFAFGYLFLARGLWAAILLHFTFDYIDVTFTVLGSGATPVYGLLNLLWMLVGAILFVHFLLIFAREGPAWLRRAIAPPRPAPRPMAVAAAPAAQPAAQPAAAPAAAPTAPATAPASTPVPEPAKAPEIPPSDSIERPPR
jgi:hypothetical protein